MLRLYFWNSEKSFVLYQHEHQVILESAAMLLMISVSTTKLNIKEHLPPLPLYNGAATPFKNL